MIFFKDYEELEDRVPVNFYDRDKCRDYMKFCLEGVLMAKDGRNRSDIKAGLSVAIVLKADQRSGNLTEGIVQDILTNSAFHPHGIKVRLTDGQVGRVKEVRE